MLLGLSHAPRRVVEERAVLLQATQAVIFLQVARHVDSHEVGRADEVRSQDGLVAETQVRAGVAARFLRVVVEVGLAVLVGVVANDLDGVLVGTHSTVGAEAVELGFKRALRQDGDFLTDLERATGDVVLDTHGELVHGLFGGEVLVNGQNLGGGGIL